MSLKQKNTKTQGTVGVGSAIQYFTSCGYVVSLPINDSQAYDIIVDIDGVLNRVQIKTTMARSKHGISTVDLRTTGGNQSYHTAKLFDNTQCELLFVLNDAGDRWLIATKDIECKSSMNLGKQWNHCKI